MEVLHKFKFVRILNDNSKCKVIMLLGTIEEAGAEHDAIVIIDKLHFDLNLVDQLIPQLHNLSFVCVNDIYYRFLAASSVDNHVKIQLIYPANQKQILKYSKQPCQFIKETSDLYNSKVKPFIDSIPETRNLWIDNIFREISEQDKVLFKREDYIIVPDSKWSGKLNELYLQGLFSNPQLKSIRDLNSVHLPLLHDIKKITLNLLYDKFAICHNQVRLFFHYHPTFYRLHLHITHIEAEYPGMMVGQSHLLDDVIDNIEQFDSLFYQKKTFNYVLGSNHELFAILEGSSK